MFERGKHSEWLEEYVFLKRNIFKLHIFTTNLFQTSDIVSFLVDKLKFPISYSNVFLIKEVGKYLFFFNFKVNIDFFYLFFFLFNTGRNVCIFKKSKLCSFVSEPEQSKYNFPKEI